MARVALVTGGTRGIGAAISIALNEAGCTVAANYAGNDEAAAKFKDETGIPVYKWSVADFAACGAGIKQVEADVGAVDILVNNAGLTRDGLALEVICSDFDIVEQVAIAGQIGDAKLCLARLLCAQYFPCAAQSEVALGDNKAVAGVAHNRNAFSRIFRQRHLI